MIKYVFDLFFQTVILMYLGNNVFILSYLQNGVYL